MFLLIEVLDVLPEDRAEAERTDLIRQLSSGRSEEEVLQANGNCGQDGNDEEPSKTMSAVSAKTRLGKLADQRATRSPSCLRV